VSFGEPHTSMTRAARLMLEHNTGCLPSSPTDASLA